MTKKLKSQSGFTMLEMLVVITIIGIIAAMLVTNFNSARARARDAARKGDLRQIKTALRLFYNDFQTYPYNSSSNIRGCGTSTGNDASTLSACTYETGDFTADGTTYMGHLPQDPLGTGAYMYQYTQRNAGDGFTLITELENPSDPDIAKSQSRCGTGTGNQYVVCED